MRQSPNGRPLVGDRLNDTSAIVAKGIKPPRYPSSIAESPSAECCVSGERLGGLLGGSVASPAPDYGHSFRRAVDHLRAGSHSGVQSK